jgi:hypothetical protein
VTLYAFCSERLLVTVTGSHQTKITMYFSAVHDIHLISKVPHTCTIPDLFNQISESLRSRRKKKQGHNHSELEAVSPYTSHPALFTENLQSLAQNRVDRYTVARHSFYFPDRTMYRSVLLSQDHPLPLHTHAGFASLFLFHSFTFNSASFFGWLHSDHSFTFVGRRVHLTQTRSLMDHIPRLPCMGYV